MQYDHASRIAVLLDGSNGDALDFDSSLLSASEWIELHENHDISWPRAIMLAGSPKEISAIGDVGGGREQPSCPMKLTLLRGAPFGLGLFEQTAAPEFPPYCGNSLVRRTTGTGGNGYDRLFSGTWNASLLAERAVDE